MSVTPAQRASDLLSLARRVVSHDPEDRRSGAEWTWARTHTGGIITDQQIVLGQLCVWAWSLEDDPAVADELMRAISTLEWVVAPAQVLGVAASFAYTARSDPEESLVDDLEDLRVRHPAVTPRLLDVDACRRAVDLARGIASTDARERLGAARLAADVVASRNLADEEAGCFAGLLGYAVVVEPDPAVRHEQATALGIAAHHGRLSEPHREIARAADLTDAERSGLDGGP